MILNQNYLELTGLFDSNLSRGGTRVRSERLNLLDNVVAFSDFAKDDMLAVKPRARNCGNEKLGTVGVGSSIGHRKKTGLGVAVSKVLVRETVAVDGLATSTVATGEITALEHKVGDDAVEWGAGIAETLFASAEGAEVFTGLGDSFVVEVKDDAAKRLTCNSIENVLV